MKVHGQAGPRARLRQRGADERHVAVHGRVLHDAVAGADLLADLGAELLLLGLGDLDVAHVVGLLDGAADAADLPELLAARPAAGRRAPGAVIPRRCTSAHHDGLNLEDRHGLALALHGHRAQRTDIILPFQQRPGRLADDDPGAVLLVQRLEPGAQVHRVADHGVAHDRVGADVAGHHLAAVDADADVQARPPERLPFGIQHVERPDHLQRRLHRVLGVVRVVERRAEERHHHVADELVERAVVREHHLHHAREVLVQLRDDVLGLALLGDAR